MSEVSVEKDLENEQNQIEIDQIEENKPKEIITKRDRIVDEIYTTELSYVKTLEQCIEYYYKPFLNCPELTEIRKNEIFLYLPEISSTASAFLKDMEQYRNDQTLPIRVVDCFKSFIPYLKVYKMFIGNNEICLHALAAIEKNPLIISYLEECRLKIPGNNKQPLRSILIMPVQRIPRYVLLLKDLSKNTDETHSQFITIQEVLKEVEELAQICNAALLNTERMIKMFKIRDVVKGYNGELVNSSRYFIKEGFLTKQCRKTPKPRYFYLFNDQLIYGTETMGTVTVSDDRIIDLLDCIITDIPDSTTRKFAFQIQSGNRSFVVFAKNADIKKEWLESINNAIEKQNLTITAKTTRTTVVRPVFKPDSEALNCELCHIDFTFVRRRHHCRACGRCICGECSKWKMPIPPNNTMERVCAKCIDMYNKNQLREKEISTREKKLDNEFTRRSIFEQQKILSGGNVDDPKVKEDWQEFEDIEVNKNPIKSQPKIPSNTNTVSQQHPVQLSASTPSVHSAEPPKKRPPPPPKKNIPPTPPKKEVENKPKEEPIIEVKEQVVEKPKEQEVVKEQIPVAKKPPQLPAKPSELTQSSPLLNNPKLSDTSRLSYRSRPLPKPPAKNGPNPSQPDVI